MAYVTHSHRTMQLPPSAAVRGPSREELEALTVAELRERWHAADLPEVEGTGARGRVLKADLVNALLRR